MLKRNIIKSIMSDVNYCTLRLKARPLKMVVNYFNSCLGIQSPYRNRCLYERQKGYKIDFHDFLKSYLSEHIEEKETQSGNYGEPDLIVNSISDFFLLLKDNIEQKRKLTCFISDVKMVFEKNLRK